MADKNRGNPKNETKNRAPRPQPTLLFFFFKKKKKNMMMTVVKKWGKKEEKRKRFRPTGDNFFGFVHENFSKNVSWFFRMTVTI